MSLVVAVVTTPPVTDTLTTSVVPWTTSRFVGASRVIFTGVDGRWPRPPTGVGYGVGAVVPDPVGPPSAAADPHADMQTSSTIMRTRSGQRMIFIPARSIMSTAGNLEAALEVCRLRPPRRQRRR